MIIEKFFYEKLLNILYKFIKQLGVFMAYLMFINYHIIILPYLFIFINNNFSPNLLMDMTRFSQVVAYFSEIYSHIEHTIICTWLF